MFQLKVSFAPLRGVEGVERAVGVQGSAEGGEGKRHAYALGDEEGGHERG